MIIYSAKQTPRLQYIGNFFSHCLTGRSEALITTDAAVFSNAEGPKINYSDAQLSADEIWIQPHGLLFQEAIRSQNTECFLFEGSTAFFKTGGDLPFDVLAAAFYLISRYEEYLPHQLDSYGRYAHENSLAYKEGFIKLPLVNRWLQKLRHLAEQKWRAGRLNKSEFQFLPTYDIDEAFSYKHKGLLRTTGGLGKALLRGNFEQVQQRIAVLAGRKKDPFDSYEWLDALHQQHRLQPRYFFLVAPRLSRYDRNISPGKPVLQQLIRSHAASYNIGLHPSWQSGDNPARVAEEIKILGSISGKTIHASRQHFIRFTLPQTYRQLIACGITEEFSMGYGSLNGFRASVATPFYWYDLERETETGLLVYPFCYMEANSFFEQKHTPAQAFDEMMHYYHTTKQTGGTLVTIWHNTFLGTDALFRGWRAVYHQFIASVR